MKAPTLFESWQCMGLPGLPFDDTPVAVAEPVTVADAGEIHHGPDCAAFDDGTCLPWRGRSTSLAPLPDERPCPLAKCGGFCYHYMPREGAEREE